MLCLNLEVVNTELLLQELHAQVQLTEGLAQLMLQDRARANVNMLLAITHPDKYNGEPANCCGFRLQCYFFYNVHPKMNKQARITHFINFPRVTL